MSNTKTAPSSRLKDLFHELVQHTEKAVDTVHDFITRDSDQDATVRLVGYTGFETREAVHLKGRVLLDRPMPEGGESDWARFRMMMALYNSHELGGVTVRCEAHDETAETVSDEEGYFSFTIPHGDGQPAQTRWNDYHITAPHRDAKIEPISVPALAPGSDSQWGVISDIDDTILETGATDFLKNWRRVLIEQADERMAVPGAPEMYRHIEGGEESPTRPFFYVSSSPWNLFPMINEFMRLNNIPVGPLFLRDYGIDRDKLFHSAHGDHKSVAIDTIISSYPQRKFLLVGDSGQHDVHIYADAVKRAPNRFGAVLIRDVGENTMAGEKAETLDELKAAGVPTFVGESFAEAFDTLDRLGLDNPAEVAKAAGVDVAE